MATYFVAIPIAGSSTFEVEANDREEAIAKAWAAVDGGADGDVTWEYFDSIVSGNVCHVPANEVEVTKGK